MQVFPLVLSILLQQLYYVSRVILLLEHPCARHSWKGRDEATGNFAFAVVVKLISMICKE